MTILKCRFLRLRDDVKVPTKATENSEGFDIYPSEDTWIEHGETMLIGTGLVAIPPIGYHFELVLRSSTPKRFPGVILANSIGIIDSDYVGEEDEIKLLLINTSNVTYRIPNDKPIAQLLLRQSIRSESEEITLERHRQFNFKKRGGFGSTDDKGKKNG